MVPPEGVVGHIDPMCPVMYMTRRTKEVTVSDRDRLAAAG